jgi:hypothetical protein
MGLPQEPYFNLLVESFYSGPISGRHGPRHVRPVEGQGVDTRLYVECSKEMRELFQTGTMFVVTAKYSNKQGGIEFLKAPYHWGYTVVTAGQARRFLSTGKVPVARSRTK